MPSTITMPKLSPTMQEGTIVKWHKKEGDQVAAGDVLIEVATDKATVEYNALDGGFLRKILVPEGSSATVNQPIAIFTDTADEKIEEPAQKETKKQPSKKEKQVEPTSKKEESPKKEESFSTPPSQKRAFTPEPPLENYDFKFPSQAIDERTAASPLAKKLAAEKGIDLSTVKGTGPGGRVTSRDIDLAQPNQTVTFGRRQAPILQPGSFEEIPLSPMRKAIAERLQQAKQEIPHIYIHQEIDAGPLFEAREQLKKGQLKVSINDFIIRAAALTMKEHPHCNSGYNASKQSIVLFKTIDVAVAVSVEGGLLTPIIRHADYKNVGEISLEIKQLAAKAKQGKLQPEEYRGGSFTISNMGMFQITDFCAILNPPQSAILAVGGIRDVPQVKNSQVVPGKAMSLTLSVDHRILDGSDGAKWLKTLQHYLENPALLLV